MPVVTIEPNSKIGPTFPYPPSGRARIWLKASTLVDVYVSDPATAKEIESLETAAKHAGKVLIYNSRWQMNEVVILPPAWNTTGWTLTIAHGVGGANRAVGVHYEVYFV
jgi:hypothetical protein